MLKSLVVDKIHSCVFIFLLALSIISCNDKGGGNDSMFAILPFMDLTSTTITPSNYGLVLIDSESFSSGLGDWTVTAGNSQITNGRLFIESTFGNRGLTIFNTQLNPADGKVVIEFDVQVTNYSEQGMLYWRSTNNTNGGNYAPDNYLTFAFHGDTPVNSKGYGLFYEQQGSGSISYLTVQGSGDFSSMKRVRVEDNGSTITLFINGAFIGTSTVPSISFSGSYIGFACRENGYGGGMYIDNVKIYQSTVPANGLIAEYLFSGNANDSSGNSLHGTVIGAVLTSDRFGNYNKAYSFDGANDYISIANTSILRPGSAITVSAWVRGASSDGNWQGIVAKSDDSTTFGGYAIHMSEDSLCFSVSTSSGGTATHGDGTSISGMGWFHLVGIYDSSASMIYMYLNGSLIHSETVTGDIVNSTNNLFIGREGCDLAGRYFNGEIDDVRIYNRALSNIEVQALYNENGYSPAPL